MIRVQRDEILEFEWDEGNLNKNWIQHRVTNKEAEEIFIDRESALFQDVKHSLHERRYMILGKTLDERKLAVFFTYRGNHIRIISARDMNKKERRRYEKKV